MFLGKGKSITSEPISSQRSHFAPFEKTKKLNVSKGFLVFSWVIKWKQPDMTLLIGSVLSMTFCHLQTAEKFTNI